MGGEVEREIIIIVGPDSFAQQSFSVKDLIVLLVLRVDDGKSFKWRRQRFSMDDCWMESPSLEINSSNRSGAHGCRGI